VLPPWAVALAFALNRAAACTYMPNASWRRRGVASARGGGSPTLETERSGSGKGGAKRRAAQAKRGSLGKPLARARGGAPLRSFCAFAVAFSFCSSVLHRIRVAVALSDFQRMEVDSKCFFASSQSGIDRVRSLQNLLLWS